MTARLPTTERDANVMHRAYSVLDVKEVDEGPEFFRIKGIASTPTPDRMEDVVEPMGAQFKTPMPLLWQHEAKKPVGLVTFAKPTKNGIPFEASLPYIKEPGVLKDRVDEAIQSIKYRLVAAVSIGFQPVRDAVESIKDGGYRFLEWEWLELSLVTIPAQAEALITSFKQFDQASLRAPSSENAVKPVVRFDPSPSVEGQPARPPTKGKSMLIKDQIAALEAAIAAKAARMQEIMEVAGKEGRSTDENEAKEFDGLKAETSVANADLTRLKDLQALNISAAKPPVDDGVTTQVTKAAAPAFSGARVSINAKLEPGIKFARMALCVARAKYLQKEGRFIAPDDIYRAEKRWMDSAPDVPLAMKAAVNADDSTTAAGASEWAYAQNIASEFIEYLRPRTLLGRIDGWRRVPFNCRIGGMDGGATGYWVGQGLGIPASRPTSTSVSLGITKVGGICVITKELAMLSTPSAELMIRNDLAAAIQQKSDTSLIDPNSGGTTNVQPASLLYGVTGRQASGTDFAAFKADWKAMTTNFYANNIPMDGSVIIMKEELAEALSLVVTSLGNPQFPGMTPTGGTLMGRPVFTTQVADTSGSPDFDNLLILLQPNQVFLADDGGASVEASDQVSIEMSDAPGNKSTATATGASLVSMFQTESIAIKGLRHVNWAKARTQACQYIRSAAYV